MAKETEPHSKVRPADYCIWQFDKILVRQTIRDYIPAFVLYKYFISEMVEQLAQASA